MDVWLSLSNQLVARMKAVIPQHERSKILAALLEQEICSREQKLFLSAKILESNKNLKKEMNIWGKEFGQDGLEHEDVVG